MLLADVTRNLQVQGKGPKAEVLSVNIVIYKTSFSQNGKRYDTEDVLSSCVRVSTSTAAVGMQRAVPKALSKGTIFCFFFAYTCRPTLKLFEHNIQIKVPFFRFATVK